MKKKSHNKKRRIIFFLSALLLCQFVTACGIKKDKQRVDMEYTVCDETGLPDELRDIIEEKKKGAFKLSYVNNDGMYIAVGYGAHNRQNLSVIVEDVYKTDNAIYVDTNLYTSDEINDINDSNIATAGDAIKSGQPSMYPYIVIKCEKTDLPVVFDAD